MGPCRVAKSGFSRGSLTPHLADARQDLFSHPILEGLGLGLVGTHHQLVEAAFGDEQHPESTFTGNPIPPKFLGLIQVLGEHGGYNCSYAPSGPASHTPHG